MKSKTLTKIAIASTICAPACGVERGVVIDRQGLPEENALYVNLLPCNNSARKPMFVGPSGIFEADRKLFFADSSYIEPFIFALPGDTVAFYNPSHSRYIKVNKTHRIRDINGVRERDIIRIVKSLREYQK